MDENEVRELYRETVMKLQQVLASDKLTKGIDFTMLGKVDGDDYEMTIRLLPPRKRSRQW